MVKGWSNFAYINKSFMINYSFIENILYFNDFEFGESFDVSIRFCSCNYMITINTFENN